VTRDHLAIARRYVEAWSQGDVDDLLGHVDPRVEVDWSESHAPYAGVYHGIEGWNKLFAETRTAFSEAWSEVHEYVERGPHVAIANTAHMRGRDGLEVTARSTLVMTFDGDRIVAAKLFQDHADALRAIGAATD